MPRLIAATWRKYFPGIVRLELLVFFACALSANAAEITAPPLNLTAAERQRFLETEAKKKDGSFFTASARIWRNSLASSVKNIPISPWITFAPEARL